MKIAVKCLRHEYLSRKSAQYPFKYNTVILLRAQSYVNAHVSYSTFYTMHPPRFGQILIWLPPNFHIIFIVCPPPNLHLSLLFWTPPNLHIIFIVLNPAKLIIFIETVPVEGNIFQPSLSKFWNVTNKAGFKNVSTWCQGK